MRARDLAGLLTLAALVGCASSPHEGHESLAAAPPPLDSPAATPAPAPEPASALVDDESGLAEYERLLAANEDRLRAAGVLVAQRELAGSTSESRFAAPPPSAAAASGDVAAGAPTGGTAPRTKRKDNKAPTVATTATRSASTPKPASPSKTRAEKAEAPPADAKPSDADEGARGGRCQQVCDLADATCDLSGKICDLAARHPGDARYTGLCQRADDDCDLAAAACQRCSP
jgi:hypothetical protein